MLSAYCLFCAIDFINQKSTACFTKCVSVTVNCFEKGFYPSGAPVSTDAFIPSGALLKAILVSSGDQVSQLLLLLLMSCYHA